MNVAIVNTTSTYYFSDLCKFITIHYDIGNFNFEPTTLPQQLTSYN